jgi:prepilin-type N-terminal cleavage/methylation domain-containing protein
MKRLVREESGFTLTELLTAMVIMVLILGATLSALEVFGNTSQRNRTLTEAQDKARIALDRVSRELLNATAYSTTTGGATQPSAILRADPWDLIMLTVNPTSAGAGNQNALNLMRVRYCLHTPSSTLYRQWQTWTSATPPAMVAETSCPSTAWGASNKSVVATDVVNGGARRVFTYNNGDAGSVSSTPPALEDIASVRIALWVDPNPGKAPVETQLHSGVFLRNKNRRPVADCTAAPTGNRYVSLNGSRSSDPEGSVLTFTWSDGATAVPGAGSLVNYQAPTTGSHTFTVTVKDPGGLVSTATCQANVI